MKYSRFIVAAAFLVPFLCLFGKAIIASENFVFRDAAHYYYPLYEYVARQWSEGIPLWNPLEELGRPLLADNTAAVFYPGKLIFTLPISFDLAYRLYIVGHVVLAFCNTYLVARRWRASRYAAGLAALAYTFSGNVFFQYCNVVFLVGAAWLPLAMCFGERLVTTRRWRYTWRLGLVLAMMVLGGDPQCAYHVGLALGLLLLVGWIGNDFYKDKHRVCLSQFRLATRQVCLLLLAAGIGCALAAVQVLPTLEWTRQSDRHVRQGPRNVYELFGSEVTHWRRLFAQPPAETHERSVYEFSVAPWRLIELFWPNVSGRQFPLHRRWMSGIPSEGRIWTPSLYMGILSVLLWLTQIRIRGSDDVRGRWLTWLSLLAIIAGFGWHGIGSLSAELGINPD